jgi:preprotein translocase subunit SecG
MILSPILASVVTAMLGWALLLLSLFLILLILVQRGRGGGLTGALGGPGGQSAFGTKAGDLFTRITSFVALGWIGLCAFTMWLIGSHAPSVAIDPTPTVSPSPADRPPATMDMIDFGDGAGAIDGGGSPGTTELTPAVPADRAPTDLAPRVPADAETPGNEPALEPAGTSAEPDADLIPPTTDTGNP